MVKKGNCIGYGILYCCGKNYINKVDGVIKKSDELSIFFILISYSKLWNE